MFSVFSQLGKRFFSTPKQKYLAIISKYQNSRLVLQLSSFGLINPARNRSEMLQVLTKYIENHPEKIAARLKSLDSSADVPMQVHQTKPSASTSISDYCGQEVGDRPNLSNSVLVEIMLSISPNIVTPVANGIMYEDLEKAMMITTILCQGRETIIKELKMLLKRSSVMEKMRFQDQIRKMETKDLQNFAIRIFCLQKEYKNTRSTIDITLPTESSRLLDFLRSATLMKNHMSNFLQDQSKDSLKLLIAQLLDRGLRTDITNIIENCTIFGFLDEQFSQTNDSQGLKLLRKYYLMIIQKMELLVPNSEYLIAGEAEALYELTQTVTNEREGPESLSRIMATFEDSLNSLSKQQNNFLITLSRQNRLLCLLKSIYLLKDKKVDQRLATVLVENVFEHYLIQSEEELIIGLVDFCLINQLTLNKEQIESMCWNPAITCSDPQTMWKSFLVFKRTVALAMIAARALEGALKRQLQSEMPNRERIIVDQMYEEIKATCNEWEKQYQQPGFFI